jgi:hypothetical protein
VVGATAGRVACERRTGRDETAHRNWTSGRSSAGREEALDLMAEYSGDGDQRWYSDALATERVSF